MINMLRKVPLFSSLGDGELEAIHNASFVKKFPREHLIFLADEEGDTLFFIIRGKVKVTQFSENGKEVIFSILNEGDFFGDMSLLDGRPRSASVITAEESELLLLRRQDFHGLIVTHPKIALSLLKEITLRLRKADERIQSLALLDVSGRVAGILLQLADECGRKTADGGIFIRTRPTHQELANMVGTTRETVTRILKQMESRNYIAMTGKSITILSPENLRRDLYR
ncbi:MAG: Crp/Fnr family transcriptional regulator [Candidatus Latescibacterota bacterium]